MISRVGGYLNVAILIAMEIIVKITTGSKFPLITYRAGINWFTQPKMPVIWR